MNEVRTFDTGATRDTEDGKYDYEGVLSPLALRRYAEYMHKHRKQSDGKLRDSDNWQKGIPFTAYMKSMFRHLVDVWGLHRGSWGQGVFFDDTELIEEALCGVIFNAFGYLHELKKCDTDMNVIELRDSPHLPLPPPTYGWSE